jgi:hypothetical protein
MTMRKTSTVIVAAGALLALSGCYHDPYSGNSYYGGGFYGSANGGGGYGYYGYGPPRSSYSRGYYGPYRDRYYDRRNYRRY